MLVLILLFLYLSLFRSKLKVKFKNLYLKSYIIKQYIEMKRKYDIPNKLQAWNYQEIHRLT